MVDLFSGTADYYARYRLPYPATVFDLLINRFRLNQSSKVLDVGTGPGQLALPLAEYCAEVVALDVNLEMVKIGARLAQPPAQAKLRWLVSAAEALPFNAARFQLVTIGGAFHWMERTVVMRELWPLICPGGGIALLGVSDFLRATEPWTAVISATVQEWLGPERRAGASLHSATHASNHRPFAEILAEGGFAEVADWREYFIHEWSPEAIIGYLYSTSYCNPRLLGAGKAAFEQTLRARLLAIAPTGRLQQRVCVDLTMGWKPATSSPSAGACQNG